MVAEGPGLEACGVLPHHVGSIVKPMATSDRLSARMSLKDSWKRCGLRVAQCLGKMPIVLRCNHEVVRGCRRYGLRDMALLLVGFLPYRCIDCMERMYRFAVCNRKTAASDDNQTRSAH